MAFQSVFQRYELKYLITLEQKNRILEAMEPYMELDQYGRTTIRNLYFDTDNYLLIRRSIEKPIFKEKLRVRSYGEATGTSNVFVEIKRKYDGTVYKRRVSMAYEDAISWLGCEQGCSDRGQKADEQSCLGANQIGHQKDTSKSTQISCEINYMIDYYGSLHPTVFLSYEREAYYTKNGIDKLSDKEKRTETVCDQMGADFRVTFDDHILVRQDDLSLESEVYGTPILPEGMVMMELKCSGGIPLWMTKILSQEKIYKTSFSKYGTAYRELILPKLPLKAI